MDRAFFFGLGLLAVLYATTLVLLVSANLTVVSWSDFASIWTDPHLRAAIRLTLLTSTISAILSLFIATPIAYLLARFRFPGRAILDAIVDIPVFLPPLVVGLSLLLLFNNLPIIGSSTSLERALTAHGLRVTFAVPAILLAQIIVATAFAIRLLKTTFEHIAPECEDVARTYGSGRARAFWDIALPQANRGLLAAGVLAWARAFGEFGPILVFAGATRGHTEVLATSIYLELNAGNLGRAAAVSLLMILLALILIATVRFLTPSPTP